MLIPLALAADPKKSKDKAKPLMAQPKLHGLGPDTPTNKLVAPPGVAPDAIYNEKDKTTTYSDGKKYYDHAVTLGDGMVVRFKASRILKGQELQDTVDDIINQPEYDKAVAAFNAQEKAQKAAAAKVPKSQLGPMDNEAVARHYQDRYDRMMGPNGLAIAKKMTPAQVADLPIEVRRSLQNRMMGEVSAQNQRDVRPNGQPVDTGFDLSIQGLGDSYRRIIDALGMATEQGIVSGSQGVSRLIGQEPATTEFIKNAGPTRLAKGIVQAGQYFIPYAGQVLGVAGAGQIGTGLATDPQGTVKGLAEGINPAKIFDPNVDPVEKVLTGANIVATAYGAIHGVKTAKAGYEAVGTRWENIKAVREYLNVSIPQANQIVAWAEKAPGMKMSGGIKTPTTISTQATTPDVPVQVKTPLKPAEPLNIPGKQGPPAQGPQPATFGTAEGALVAGRQMPTRAIPVEEPARPKLDPATEDLLARAEAIRAKNAFEKETAARKESQRPTLALPGGAPEPAPVAKPNAKAAEMPSPTLTPRNELKQGPKNIGDIWNGDLYREVSHQNIDSLTHSGNYWSNNPDTALGQGSNKGIVVRYRPSKSDRAYFSINTSKPGWEYAYDSGYAEIVPMTDLSGEIVSLTIKKNAQIDPKFARRYDTFVKEGKYVKSTDKNGNVVYTKTKFSEPAPVATKTIPNARYNMTPVEKGPKPVAAPAETPAPVAEPTPTPKQEPAGQVAANAETHGVAPKTPEQAVSPIDKPIPMPKQGSPAIARSASKVQSALDGGEIEVAIGDDLVIHRIGKTQYGVSRIGWDSSALTKNGMGSFVKTGKKTRELVAKGGNLSELMRGQVTPANTKIWSDWESYIQQQRANPTPNHAPVAEPTPTPKQEPAGQVAATLKVVKTRDVMRDSMPSHAMPDTPESKLAWIRENGEIASDTNRRLRYVFDLSDGQKVSMEGVIRNTDPELWAKIKENGTYYRSAKGRAELFSKLPKDAQNQLLELIPTKEIADKFDTPLYQSKGNNAALEDWLKENAHPLAGTGHPSLKQVREKIYQIDLNKKRLAAGLDPSVSTDNAPIPNKLDTAYKQAVARRKSGGTGNSNRERGLYENPAQIVLDYTVIAAYHIRNGARTAREVLNKMVQDHPYDAELIRSNLAQIISDARSMVPKNAYRFDKDGNIIGPERQVKTNEETNQVRQASNQALAGGSNEPESVGGGNRTQETGQSGIPAASGSGPKESKLVAPAKAPTPEQLGVKSALNPSEPVATTPKVRASSIPKGTPNEKTNLKENDPLRNVQDGQGTVQGEQPQGQGNGQKANAVVPEKEEVKANTVPATPSGGTPSDSAAISNKFIQDFTQADVPDADRQTVKQWVDAAIGAGHNTEAGSKKLVADVLEGNKRDFTESEGVGIAARLTDLLTEKGTKGIAPERVKAIDAEIQRIAEATKKTGTNQARAFVARAMLIGHDYSPQGVYRAYELTGESPHAKIRAELDAAIAKNAGLTKLLDAKEKGATVTKGDVALLDTVRKARASNARLMNAQDRLAAIKAKRAGTAVGMGSRERGAANISIDDIKDLKELAGAYAQMGVARFQHFVDKIRGDFKEEFAHLTDDDIAEALNQKTGDARTLEEKLIQQNVARLKREAKYIDENASRPTKQAQGLERIRKQITATEDRIKTGNVKGPKPTTDEMKAAQKQLAQLKKAERYLVENASRPTKEGARRAAVQKQIDDYENQLKTGIYKDRSRRKMQATVELQELRNKRDSARLEIDAKLAEARALAEYNAMNKAQKLWVQTKDAAASPKALQAMADVSAVGNQTWELVKRAHFRTIGKGLKDMTKSFSKEGFGEVNAALKNDAGYSEARNSGVHFQGSGLMGEQGMTPHEKLIFTNLRGKIPVISQVEGWSERTFNSYLNRARLESFKMLKESAMRSNKGKPLTEKELKVLGEYVNVISGRGSGKLGESAQLLYAPRFALSQLQTAVPGYQTAKAAFRDGGAATKAIFRSEGRGVAGQAAILATGTALASAFGGELDMDKNSTNFGRLLIPIPGKQGAYFNMDLTGGRGSWVTLISRMATGEKVRMHGPNEGGKKMKAFGMELPVITEGPKSNTRKKSQGDVAMDFLRNKSAPVVGMAVDAVRGKTPAYTDFNIQDTARSFTAPLSTQAGIRAAYETDNPFIGMLVGILNAGGFRFDAQGADSNYAKQKAEATSKRDQERKLLGPIGDVILPRK